MGERIGRKEMKGFISFHHLLYNIKINSLLYKNYKGFYVSPIEESLF